MKTNSAGILAFKSNSMLETERQQAAEGDSKALIAARTTDRLMGHCRSEWDRAREAKQPLENLMLRSMRQRQGVYDAQKLAAIQEMGGSEIKMMLTDVKCRAAIAWITDVILGTGERPFSCEPTPIPEMPPEIQQLLENEAYEDLKMISQIMPDPADLRKRTEEFKEQILAEATKRAKKMAERMAVKIDDELVEGKFYEAMEDGIDDFVTLPGMVIKGPVVNSRRELKWKTSLDPTRPNAVVAEVQKTYRRSYYCVSPWDIYMTPEAKTSEQGSLIEHHRISPSDLYDLIGVPGYNEDKIRAALKDYADTGLRDWLWNDTERARLEKRPYENILPDGSFIDTLEVWTKVQGSWLIEWGMEGIDDAERWYDAQCWMIGQHVIRATLNDDPLRKRPYHIASYVPVRNSPWGRGVPELMDDLQNMCDGAARSISNNMGLASGPQAEVEADRLAVGEKITRMQPWRIWQTISSKTAGNSPAVRFFQPPIVTEALMRVFEFFSSLADEYTGIPKYASGDPNISGAGETAAGLSMLMNASSRVMKGVIRGVDRIIIGVVTFTHRHIMLFDDEMEGKGDVKVRARATQAILHKEAQQLRLNETLMATNNPIDFQIMGPKGRLQLLRASLRGLDAVDTDEVLPSNDDMLMREFSANMMLTNAMNEKPGGQGTPAKATPGPGQ